MLDSMNLDLICKGTCILKQEHMFKITQITSDLIIKDSLDMQSYLEEYDPHW